jgi:hypothetical protein
MLGRRLPNGTQGFNWAEMAISGMARPLLGIVPLVVLLVSGCAHPGPPGFAWHEQSERAILGNLPGLELDGILFGQGKSLHVQATIHNGGEHYFQLDTGCNSPWTNELVPRVPHARPETDLPLHPDLETGCDRGDVDILGPGENRTFAMDWNGTWWDNAHGDNLFVRPPAGAYSWTLWFHGVGPCEPTCQAVGLMRLDFVVVVP